MSGLTTTGATVIAGLDELPRSLLLYRQQLQWLGGIGIIVLAVAVLPMLGIGGMQLYRAESTGPAKDRKLTPRITGTAKALFGIYLGLTALCAIAYWLAGMTAFDAICHAFSTIAIGGFSTHDASMGFFQNNTILLICTFFMVVSAINFGLHFIALQRKSLDIYQGDSETKFFCSVICIAIVVTCATLLITHTLPPTEGLIHGMFQTVSIATTTGFTTQDFALWPHFLPVMLLILSFMGGCAGSTGGGLKAMRLLLIFRQGMRELKQLLHPNAIIPLKLDARRVLKERARFETEVEADHPAPLLFQQANAGLLSLELQAGVAGAVREHLEARLADPLIAEQLDGVRRTPEAVSREAPEQLAAWSALLDDEGLEDFAWAEVGGPLIGLDV